MVRHPKPVETPLHWVGSAKADFMDFPAEVRSDMGFALGVAQLGGKHPSAKPWKGEGGGVLELVERHKGNAERLKRAQADYEARRQPPSGKET
jgi:phage-related protein